MSPDSFGKVDVLVSSKWKELIPELDGAGIPINKTLKDLLKLYPAEQVESAIAIVKARKREKHIPNPSGYLVSVLKGDWGSKSLVDNNFDSGDCNYLTEIDKTAVLRHWYDLARELEYLKKIVKRNSGG